MTATSAASQTAAAVALIAGAEFCSGHCTAVEHMIGFCMLPLSLEVSRQVKHWQ
jgi:hypothetical protein